MAVPKLRFKEFDADWEKTTLGEVVKFSNGKRVPLSETDRQKRQGKYRYYGASGVIDYVDDYLFDGQYILIGEDGANIITRSSTLAFVVEGQFWVNNHAHIFQSKHGDNVFLATYLESLNYERFNSGTAQPKLNLENLKKVPVANPQKPEQTKIASFLSTVDEKISQLTQKHALLSQYKQGIMQKLFSQQIRFKADDGSEFGEWEEVKFSDIFNFHQTNSYSRALLAEHGEIMNIHYGDIHTKFSMLFDVTKEPVPFLNDEVDTSKITNEQFLKVGDLVIADASEDYKDIGKAIEVISLNNQKVVAGLHTYIARPVKPFALGFCGYMMQTFPVREQIKKLATGISVLGISKTNLGKLELKVPFLEEQTKIANFLSAIDQKIEVVAQQIEQAKQWKKGLLQQMFV